MMKKILLISSAMIIMFGAMAQQTRTKSDGVKKKVSYAITAQGTNYRLSRQMQIQMSPHGQPYEHTPCIFVDPSKKFQTFLGIGGALTDAAADSPFYE